MTNINDLAFSLTQKIDDKNPLMTRANLIETVASALQQRGFNLSDARYAAITQVAEYENQHSMHSIDLNKSSKHVVFVRTASSQHPKAVFINDIVDALERTQAA